MTNKKIEFDLDTIPIQIRTDSATGSGDMIQLETLIWDGSDIGLGTGEIQEIMISDWLITTHVT